ncbi:hypothetical protein [Brevundimonas abyssalis]|uniref:hypothetical protein n=1 Tax=Brevundimonas abyssalis TaxID=1125965 RepID=UPI0011D27D3C|nr:hypothetical protein [Brevundimonas abyssalis]
MADSQSPCAAQHFVAPPEHHRDDPSHQIHDDRHSSCLDGIGSSHMVINMTEPNAEMRHSPREIVILAATAGDTS